MISLRIIQISQAFYSYVRFKTKVKERVGPLVNNNGIDTNDKKEMSELLNEFFSSVFTREDRRNIPQLVLRDGDNQPKIRDSAYSEIEITEDGVLQIA